MKNKALFTSYRQNWRTPIAIYNALDKEFNFDFDPCPPEPKFNGLEVEWGNCNYVNPPYTTQIQNQFVKKAVEEWKKGKTVVMLILARTSTKRFHDYILPNANEIRFLKGRLHFDNLKNGAPFPSMIVIFSPQPGRKEKS
jgi:site-specific DNA-methyltransferase (adenine-specific)